MKYFINLGVDLSRGITAGVVALSLALALDLLSALSAVSGMYSAKALGIFASLFDGTPFRIRGLTGRMSLISAVGIKAMIG